MSPGRVLFVVACVATSASCRRPAPEGGIEDRVVKIESGDPEMTAAREKAKASLPGFFRLLEHPEPGQIDFAVKVRVVDGTENEHFWLSKPTRKDGHVTGTIDNEPDVVKNVELGQRLTIREDEVEDWTYLQNGKIHGNFTLRPLLPRMPAEQAAELRARLADP